ncbi:CsbD family protein [Streptomyces sp. NPDC002057]|uniref:CsbD family protein n=1 Tax=Streptomyces sp. NPDC002057 TaxID=3154664 RepID=UPI003325A1B4
MSGTEKTKAQVEQARGKAKEAMGRMVGNDRMKAEGHTDQAKGEAREAKEDVKDSFRR